MIYNTLIQGAALSAGLLTATAQEYVVPPATMNPATYHDWAHKHWVWLQHGSSNQQNSTDLVQGYLDRGIPVGAVNIDSEWATEFNNFEVNTDKYPDLPGFVASMHKQDIRVTMWTTSMVNVENPDYEFCKESNFLVRDGYGLVRPINWWKGSGALLDYSNPDAVAWWHSKLDKVLSLDAEGNGIDGFKTDQTDLYITEYILLSGAALGYENRSLTYRDYANYYYRDFFYYTREHRGDAGLIMSRPEDCALDRITKICTPASPYDVMYSGWVGDDDATFNGLTGCLRKVIYSAWNNYANFGCDIGGYRGDSSTLDKDVFVRWTQFGAFIPLMENGGGGEHRPWMYDDETVDIYRKFVLEHYRLIPYWMNAGMASMESNGKKSALKPLAVKPEDTADPLNPQPTTYSYLIGEDILVHPVVNDKSLVEMTFPAGVNTVWLNWWNPTDMSTAVDGKDSDYTFVQKVPFDSYPVYVKKNSFIPLQDNSDESLLFTWFCPDVTENGEINTKTTTVREPESSGPGLESTAVLQGSVFSGTITAHSGSKKAGFALIGVSRPTSITSTPANSCELKYEETTQVATIVCDIALGVEVTLEGVEPIY